MNRLVILGLMVFGLVSICAADFRPCKFTEASTVSHREGVTVRRVGLVEDSGEVGATALIPDGNVPLPGALVSHSSIHGPRSTADLLRFAWELARAGAAVIVLDGTLEWDPPSNESVRDPHLMACAGQWFLLNTRLDPHRLLMVGTGGGWGGGDTPFCLPGEKPCFVPRAAIGFGETWGVAESANTDQMLTAEGQLKIAQWAQEHLKLRQIKPEWARPVSESQDAK